MKRSLSVVSMLSLIVLLSGCIISTTPKDNPVVLLPGQAKTFTIRVLPQPAKYAWYVGDNVVPGATVNSFAYMIDDVVLPSDFTIEVRATGLLGTDKYTWNVHYVGTNKPPVAEAGPDLSASVGSNVILDGSGSTDPDNNIVSYHWEQTGGPTVTLSDPNAVKPHFIADVPVGSNLTFELTVTDAGLLTSMDTCVLLVIITFNKIYGGGSYDFANAVQQTSDGGYILAGLTASFGAGSSDVWLIKTDANVNKVWDKTFGGSNPDYANAVQQTSDGGYILAGCTYSFGAGDWDAWLIKTDADGNKVWDKTFGGDNGDFAHAVQQTSDGGYILAGWTWSFGAGNTDAWLIKTDQNGNKVWDKTFGGSYEDYAYAVQNTNDGGNILAGFTASFGAGGDDAWLIKTDANGNKVWDKTFGGSNPDIAYAMHQTSDGGYILAGYTDSFVAGDSAWLIKTDANGNKVWDKTFGGDNGDCAHAVQQTSDGGYILAGINHLFGAYIGDAWLIKIDSEGNAPATPTP